MRASAILFDNPIFVRELRRRMRGRGVIFSLISYILLIGAISFGVILTLSLHGGDLPQKTGEEIGRTIFVCVAFVQAFLVWLAAPSITSGVTNSERERQTFEFLQVTTLSARAYVVGNLLSTAMYVLIVLVCALPVMSVSFLYGGIGIDDVLTTFGLLLAFSMVLSCFALFASSAFSKVRSVQSVVTSVCVAVGISIVSQRLIFASFMAPGGTPYFLQTVSLLRWSVPRWIPWAFSCALLCFALIVAAGRKLYTPDNRLFNYRQYLALFLIVQILLAGGNWGVFSATNLAGWIIASALMLYLAAMLFSTGRLAVGDEVWILKRRHPWLRRFDEGFFFILGLLAVWAAFGAAWAASAPNLRAAGWSAALSAPEVFGALSAFSYFAASTLFLFFLGRLVSQFTYTRRTAFWWLSAAGLTLYVLAPLLIDAFVFVRGGRRGAGDGLLAMSPWEVMARSEDASKLVDPALISMAALFAAAALAAAVGAQLAARRHRQVNYHFELKA